MISDNFRKSIELTEEQKKELEKKYQQYKKDRNERERNKPKWKNVQQEIFEDNINEIRY